MKVIKRHRRFYEYLLVFIFISIFSLLLMFGIFRESAVYDEKLHLDAGYIFLTKHDFTVEPFNPPLAREIIALPSLFNLKVNSDLILFYPRLLIVIITAIFGLYFYWFSKKVFGIKVALFSLFLFILEPEILAHGHYATTDLVLAFLFFLSMSICYLWRQSLNLKKICVLAMVMGLTLATKISALPFLFFSFLIIFLCHKNNLKYIMGIKKFVPIFVMLLGLTIWMTYFFTFEPLLGYRFDPNRMAIKLSTENRIINFALKVPLPLGSYVGTIKQVILYNYAPFYVKTSFLNGKILQDGSPYFFPIAFLLKTPLPIIILFAVALFTLIRNNSTNLFLLTPIVAIFASSMVSTLNLGIRYILSVYPFIILLSSQVIKLKFKYLNLMMLVLVIWYISGLINIFPHYISFFNEFAGGSKNGYKYLIDSNYDWGQGLIDLRQYQDKYKINNLQLAYFGTADPQKYGIRYNVISDGNVESLKFEKNSVVAISATCWYFCGYYKNPDLNMRSPDAIVGGSILIFNK